MVPQLIDLLDAVHQLDVSDTSGYGTFDYLGNGLSSSWRNSLLLIGQEEDERDYFGKWYHLFDDTFLERDLFKDLYQRMKHLLAYCPEERYLVYGSVSLRNTLAENGRITALLDWIDAKYGDFLYDVAYLDYWCGWLRVSERFLEYYRAQRREVPFYAERVLCYQCHHALGGMRFFAASGDEQGYQLTRAIIRQKLDAFA